MPEINECRVSADLVGKFIQSLKSSNHKRHELRVLNMWSDPTEAEIEQARRSHSKRKDPRVEQGHVYVLPPDANITRGQTATQTPVYPNILGNRKHISVAEQHLFLDSAHATPRDVVLGFKNQFGMTLWAQVKLFVHVMAQVYNKDQWTNAIMRVSARRRKFCVGIAFELQDWVVAFVSMDLIIQLYWSKSLEKLPCAEHYDILHQTSAFLEKLVTEIDNRFRSKSRRNGLAMPIVKGWFYGIGAYCICELFHRAGLRVDLLESEVFDSASRVARLVAAFWHIAKMGVDNIIPWVQEHQQEYVLAADKHHRMEFSRFLKVYGQDMTCMTKRHRKVIERMKKGDFSNDAFDPTLIQLGLEHTGWGIGRLIFGNAHWELFIAENDALKKVHDQDNLRIVADPLTAYYTQRQVATPCLSITHIDLSAYTNLVDSDDNVKATMQRTYLYSQRVLNGSHKKHDVWSVYPIPIADGATENEWFDVVDGTTRKQKLARNVIGGSNKYHVGPLDFCGVARIVAAQGSGRPQIHVCEEDPRFGEYYRKKRATSFLAASASSITNKARNARTCARTRKNPLPHAHAIPDVRPVKDESVHTEPKKKRRKKMTATDLMFIEGARWLGQDS